jgi:CRISPR system Cascade subunit CasB
MTTDNSNQQDGSDLPVDNPSGLTEVGAHVSRRAERLQTTYLQDLPSAVASLAKLRRAVGKPPGADPQAWPEVFRGLEHLGHGDEPPTRREWAAHIALTLFAVHQQSKSEKMHRHRCSLGHSVRQLADRKGGVDDEGSKAVARRFQALGTADSLDEISHHARNLITQLRAEDIPLDYGLLADQLVKLQSPATAPAIRLAWGRDFYRTRRPDDPIVSTDDSAATSPQGDLS